METQYRSIAAVLLLALLPVDVGTQLCAAPGATSIVLSVSTKRNATGHWNIAVDVNSEAERRLSARPHERGVALTLGQRTAFCNLTDAVHLFATAAVSSSAPPPGYELMQGLGYYRASPIALSWLDAVQLCEAEGAHLLVLNSDLEANVAREFFARKPSFKNHTSSTYVHLGFHDRYKENDFITVHGAPLAQTGYMVWDSSQPSGGTSNNCGATTISGRLVTAPCANRYAYICEFGI